VNLPLSQNPLHAFFAVGSGLIAVSNIFYLVTHYR
jgi:hypothetical protein